MKAIIEQQPTQRIALQAELSSLKSQLGEATSQYELLGSRKPLPLTVSARQREWLRWYLERAQLDAQIRAVQIELNQLDAPLVDAHQQWRKQLHDRIEMRLRWREVLSQSLLTHRASHIAVWGNTIETQTANIAEAERRLGECDNSVAQLRRELAENLG